MNAPAFVAAQTSPIQRCLCRRIGFLTLRPYHLARQRRQPSACTLMRASGCRSNRLSNSFACFLRNSCLNFEIAFLPIASSFCPRTPRASHIESTFCTALRLCLACASPTLAPGKTSHALHFQIRPIFMTAIMYLTMSLKCRRSARTYIACVASEPPLVSTRLA